MRHRLVLVSALLLALLLSGCGGSNNDTASGGSGTAGTSTSPTACPTENTTSFAKTRFAADIGGSLFLVNRYVVQPFQAGTFKQGASGRTGALIKAGLAAAATAKLLSNAKQNAQANPTLCKTVAGPIGQLSDQLGGLVGNLRNGSLDPAAITGLGGLLGSIKDKAGAAGIPITEKQVPLG